MDLRVESPPSLSSFGGPAKAHRATAGPAPRPQPPFTHRSFSVVKLNKPKMIATITNRAMTLGSLQPISSKW
jgi:hypothetical protein